MKPERAREIAHELSRPIIEYVVSRCKAVEAGTTDQAAIMLDANSIAEQVSEFIADREDCQGLANCIIGELGEITPSLHYAVMQPEAYITVFAGHIMFHILQHKCEEREVPASL